MLGLALLPTLSHALAGRDTRWAEVCTPQGTRLVAVDAAERSASGTPMRAQAHLEHCPYCALSAPALGPPPAVPAVLPPRPLAQAVPALFLHAPRTLFAWRSAQPRGPPAFS